MNPGMSLWHNIMYCVGVFVTCNVGGWFLRFAAGQASAYMKRQTFPEDGGRRPFDGNEQARYPFGDGEQERYHNVNDADDDSETVETVVGVVVDANRGQDFDDMKRQIENIH